MSEIEFVIQDNVEIPKREFSGTRAERESQYPIAHMKQGQSFAVGIKGEANTKAKQKDGTEKVLTVAESAKRYAAQKQSYFSSLGKRTGVDIVTRYFPDGEPTGDLDDDGNAILTGQPTLRVWHNGPRKEKPAKGGKAAANATSAAQNAADTDDGELDL